MTGATSLDDALIALDAAVSRMAGGGRRSRQAREVRAAAARVRAGAAALAAGAGQIDALDAFDLVLRHAREAGIPWSELAEHFNAAGERLAGPGAAR